MTIKRVHTNSLVLAIAGICCALFLLLPVHHAAAQVHGTSRSIAELQGLLSDLLRKVHDLQEQLDEVKNGKADDEDEEEEEDGDENEEGDDGDEDTRTIDDIKSITAATSADSNRIAVTVDLKSGDDLEFTVTSSWVSRFHNSSIFALLGQIFKPQIATEIGAKLEQSYDFEFPNSHTRNTKLAKLITWVQADEDEDEDEEEEEDGKDGDEDEEGDEEEADEDEEEDVVERELDVRVSTSGRTVTLQVTADGSSTSRRLACEYATLGTVEWGDDEESAVRGFGCMLFGGDYRATVTHTYDEAGDYTITVKGTKDETEEFDVTIKESSGFGKRNLLQ